MSARTPGGTFIGILDSQTAQDDIINRFDLRRVYHRKFYFDTRKILTERTAIVEDKKSGIISIAVTDRDPNRARDLAEAYVEELNKLVNKVSTSSAVANGFFWREDYNPSKVISMPVPARSANSPAVTQRWILKSKARQL
jgi:capsular polysaccharide biosynthesis protein